MAVREFFKTNVFNRNLKAKSRTIINIGGARSSKSYSISQLFAYKMRNEQGKEFGICRKTMPALKMTAYRLFIDMVKEWGLYNRDWHNKTEHFFDFKPQKNRTTFFSLDDPEKLKSSEFNYIWMEEANEFTYQDYITLLTRLSGKASSNNKNQIFLSLNPIDYNNWIAKKLAAQSDVEIIKSTYKDNPFLAKEYIQILKDLKDQDKNSYKVYALGEWGSLENLIYNNYSFIDDFPKKENLDEIIYGLDFGFNNPSALVKIGLKENNAYLQQVLYETKLTNSQLIEKLKVLNIEPNLQIYADSAEPNRIEEICKAGFNCFPSDKDVNKGIDTVKSYKKFITKDSADLIKEIQSHSWQTNKTGDVIDIPIKINDHACDAVRYGIYSYCKKYKMSEPLRISFI
jgi:phage terminase large subunit